ncbi:MAG: metallophosphoesterase, partial [Vallitaleaceae bacterium]|nr:metallophosphoesterase [Vallitaleaceae bacterium]
MRKRKKLPMIIFILFLGLIAEFFVSNYTYRIYSYTISHKDIPTAFDGYKIIQLSDLHSHDYGDSNESVYQSVLKATPDLIVMTGDMVSSSDRDFSTFYSLVKKLVTIAPVYYVFGNHEQALDDEYQDEILSTIADLGVRYLDNETVQIEKEGSTISLHGMWFNLRFYNDSRSSYEYTFELDNMMKLLKFPEDQTFDLLLTHNPIYFSTYKNWGADLTLTGHIHGGLINIPFMGGLLSPERTTFPEYDAGLFQEEDHYLIVNRGLGNGRVGFRYFNRPEISL